MRLHSNIITSTDIRDALRAEQEAGRIATTVEFKILTNHGSRTHSLAHEVQLSSWAQVPGDGRRVGNSGSYGAMNPDGGYAATFDEWGWLMAAIYRADPLAVWGSVKHPQYSSAEDFHSKTGETYSLFGLLEQLERGTDPYPYVAPRMLKARQGAGRYAGPVTAWGQNYTKLAPRTAGWYREFACLEAADCLA